MQRPKRPRDSAPAEVWQRYHEKLQEWEGQRRQSARNHGRYPGSTHYTGSSHGEDGHAGLHVDKKVTGLDGGTTKEHSADPDDIVFGEKIEVAVQEMRRQKRKQ